MRLQIIKFGWIEINNYQVERENDNMVEKSIKQIIEENKGNEIHLLDELGIWGELPLTEHNLQLTPDAVEINDYVVRMYVG